TTSDPREEPGALAALAGISAGGEEQSSSLPRPSVDLDQHEWCETPFSLRPCGGSRLQIPGRPSIKDDHDEMPTYPSDVCHLDASSRCECTANHRYGQDHVRPIPRYVAVTVG